MQKTCTGALSLPIPTTYVKIHANNHAAKAEGNFPVPPTCYEFVIQSEEL